MREERKGGGGSPKSLERKEILEIVEDGRIINWGHNAYLVYLMCVFPGL